MKSYTSEPWFRTVHGNGMDGGLPCIDADAIPEGTNPRARALLLRLRDIAMREARVQYDIPYRCVMDMDEQTGYLRSPYRRLPPPVPRTESTWDDRYFELTCSRCTRVDAPPIGFTFEMVEGEPRVASMPNVWLIDHTTRLAPLWVVDGPLEQIADADGLALLVSNETDASLVDWDRLDALGDNAYNILSPVFTFDPYLADPDLAHRIRGMFELACPSCGAGHVSIGPQKLHCRLVALAEAGVERMTIQDFSRRNGSH